MNITSSEFSVIGNPVGYGSPLPYGYGTRAVGIGVTITNSVTNVVDGPPGTRYQCAGWRGTGSVQPVGYSNRVSFILNTDSVLTWNWTTQYRMDLSCTAGGSLDHEGGWHNTASSLTVIASSSNYYCFTNWSGDIGGCQASSNRLTVVMDQPRTIAAEFAAEFVDNGVPKWWLAMHGLTNFVVDAMADGDGDGSLTWQEYYAGTDPTNKPSVFKFSEVDNLPAGFVVRWLTETNRFYTLRGSTNLLEGTNGFVVRPGCDGIEGTGKKHSYTDTVTGAGSFFYRVSVHQ